MPYHWARRRRARDWQRPARPGPRPQRPHPRGQGAHLRRPRRAPAAGPGLVALLDGYRCRPASGDLRAAREGGAPVTTERGRVLHRHLGVHRLQGVRGGLQGVERRPRGWPGVHRHSYDNTAALASTWRHVAFIEQTATARCRWLMSSDVCKHCTPAACLEVCPTARSSAPSSAPSSCSRTCATAAATACPRVPMRVDRRQEDGMAHKCTLCYDRLKDGMSRPVRRPVRPSRSSSATWRRERAGDRVEALHDAGVSSARLYGDDPDDGVGGDGAIFLLLDEPEVYGLPPISSRRTATWALCGARRRARAPR